MGWGLILVGAIVLGGALVIVWRERQWLARLRQERADQDARLDLERQTSGQAIAQQRAVFESMIEGVLVLDRRGRITMANRSLRELMRVTSELRGRTMIEAFGISVLAEMAASLPTKHLVRNPELELLGPARHLLEVNASAVLNEKGGYEGGIFVFHDLTRVKQLENTRREFVANVSHELRTPLSLIKGFVETLLDAEQTDPVQMNRFLRTVQKHTNRLTFLIEDLLTISQLESGPIQLHLQPLPVRAVAQRVIQDLRGRAQENGTAIDNLLPPDLEVGADADRLEQVFSNLIENAIKYGRKGGRISLQVAEDTTAGLVTLTVEDDGPGIPYEAQDRIFERFYRVDRARSRETGGTGLGLSIVKHIILAHGGSVWVQSHPGRGATFFFTLPRVGSEGAATPPGEVLDTTLLEAHAAPVSAGPHTGVVT